MPSSMRDFKINLTDGTNYVVTGMYVQPEDAAVTIKDANHKIVFYGPAASVSCIVDVTDLG